MPTSSPPNYRTAPGSDRCDRCFHRADSGLACKKWPDFDSYVPNGLCDVYAERSMAQRFEDEQAAEKVDPDAATLDEFGQTLKDIEIFRSGNWNNKSYTAKDLDDMVKAAAEVGYKPPVTLGHTDDPSAPAYGYAVNLRRVGDTLLADFEDVPDDLVTQIRDKRYDTVSAEIYFDLKRGKKTFRRALRSVAVLGAHPPGVSDLKPLSAALGQLAERAASEIVDYQPEDPDMPTTKQAAEPGTAGNTTQEPTTAVATPPVTNPAPPANVTQQQADVGEVARLQAALEAATNDAAAARREAEAARALAQHGNTAQLDIQRLQERNRAVEAALTEIFEGRRRERIKTLVDSVQRPALRNHIQALAELGTVKDKPGAEPERVMFQAAGASEAAPTDALGVLEDFVRLLNKQTEHLFTEAVEAGDMSRRHAASYVDDPSNTILELMGEYRRAHPTVTVDEARAAILGDPKHRDLVRRYNAVTNGLN